MPRTIHLGEDTGPLTRRITASQFSQQGQVDWVELSRSTIGFSVDILSRLSAASVDPYTVTVGHFLGATFELSKSGREHMQEALSRLHSFDGLGNVLWFGFGIRPVVRTLCVTEEGAVLVALCAALSECFPLEYAAEILHEMVRRKDPTKLAPAVGEWRTLLSACSGIFSTTAFPRRAETLMALQDDEISSGDYAVSVGMAEALEGVGNVSRRVWNSLTIIGGRDAGWIAAVAEWLFGLTVSITGRDGSLMYVNCESDQCAQVHIVICGVEDDPNLTLQVVDKTFDLRQAIDLIRMQGGDDPMTSVTGAKLTPISGRIPWDRCLAATFGQLFDKLLSRSGIVGTLIGSAARIFEAIAHAEEGVPCGVLQYHLLYLEGACGSSLVQNMLHWLPELKKASSSNIQSALSASTFEESRNQYEAAIALLSTTCPCHECNHSVTDAQLPATRCMVKLFETIMVLGRFLSAADVADGLYPCLNGLERIYRHQSAQAWHDFSLEEPLGTIENLLDNPPGTTKTFLEFAAYLFSGRELFVENPNVGYSAMNACAISVSGICVYLDCLCEVSDSPELVGRIDVVPGRVEHQGRPFLYVENQFLRQHYRGETSTWWTNLQNPNDVNGVKAIVRETSTTVELHYEILNIRGQGMGIFVTPLELVRKANLARGLVACQHANTTGELSPALKLKLQHGKVDWKILLAPTLGRCAALMECNAVISQDNSCLDCCVREALIQAFQTIVIISKHHPGDLEASGPSIPIQLANPSNRLAHGEGRRPPGLLES